MNATTSSPFIISQGRNVPQRAMVMADMTPRPSAVPSLPTGRRDPGEVTSGVVTGNVLNVTAWNFWNEDTRALTITLLSRPSPGDYDGRGGPLRCPALHRDLDPGPGQSRRSRSFQRARRGRRRLRLNEGIPSPMSPDIFEVLLNSTVPAWQEKAAFSYIVLKQLAQGCLLSPRL